MFLCVDILLVKTFKEWLIRWDNIITSSYSLKSQHFLKRLNSDTIPQADFANVVILK